MRTINHTFNNIEEVIDYIEIEEKAILDRERPHQPPFVIRSIDNMFRQPYDGNIIQNIMVKPNSIKYPFAAYYNDADDDKFIMTPLFSGRYSLKPNLRKRAFLFRGENEWHPKSYPSIFRKEQKSYLGNMILIDEMNVLLMNHPLIKLLHNGFEIRGKTMAFEMNTYGLAQHYETKTALMDLTSDINVAAFFATSKYDENTKEYTPITDESKEGVLYLFKLDPNRFLPDNFMKGKPTLHTIGLQLFPRSGQQKGFLLDMQKGINFNEQEEVTVIKFRHNAEKSIEIYELMDGGNKLFPNDILADYCNRSDRKIVSHAAIHANLKRNPKETFKSLVQKLKELGFTITEKTPLFSPDEMMKFYKDLHNGGWEQFCKQIHYPVGCDEISYDELLNLMHREEYKLAFGIQANLTK